MPICSYIFTFASCLQSGWMDNNHNATTQWWSWQDDWGQSILKQGGDDEQASALHTDLHLFATFCALLQSTELIGALDKSTLYGSAHTSGVLGPFISHFTASHFVYSSVPSRSVSFVPLCYNIIFTKHLIFWFQRTFIHPDPLPASIAMSIKTSFLIWCAPSFTRELPSSDHSNTPLLQSNPPCALGMVLRFSTKFKDMALLVQYTELCQH